MLPPAPRDRAKRRRPQSLLRSIEIEIQLSNESGKRDPSFLLDAHRRMELHAALARRRRQSILRDNATSLLPAVPGFARERQQPDVVLLEIPSLGDRATTCASARSGIAEGSVFSDQPCGFTKIPTGYSKKCKSGAGSPQSVSFQRFDRPRPDTGSSRSPSMFTTVGVVPGSMRLRTLTSLGRPCPTWA